MVFSSDDFRAELHPGRIPASARPSCLKVPELRSLAWAVDAGSALHEEQQDFLPTQASYEDLQAQQAQLERTAAQLNEQRRQALEVQLYWMEQWVLVLEMGRQRRLTPPAVQRNIAMIKTHLDVVAAVLSDLNQKAVAHNRDNRDFERHLPVWYHEPADSTAGTSPDEHKALEASCSQHPTQGEPHEGPSTSAAGPAWQPQHLGAPQEQRQFMVGSTSGHMTTTTRRVVCAGLH